MSADALAVDSDVSIPRHELTFRATRAGGPGGQHVNTSSTRIELQWNPKHSRALSEDQRARLLDKLAGRLDARGNIRIVASAYRSQARNREDAEQRLAALVRRSVAIPRPRKKTRPTRGSVEQRLQSKKKVSEKKSLRRDPGFE